MIKDSGERREFSSGSVRDTAIGKGRCDLLPLGVITGWINTNETLESIGKYMETGDLTNLANIVDDFTAKVYDCCYETMMLDLAKHFENGAKKYSERNWEKGQPLHVYMDSAIRHYLQYRRGDKDENHGIAFVWNIVCAMWTHENLPEMIDLPFKEPTTWEGDPNDFWEYESTLQKVCVDGVCSLKKVEVEE